MDEESGRNVHTNPAFETKEEDIQYVAEANVSIELNNVEEIQVPEKHEEKKTRDLFYTVDESPEWYMCILLGLQHYLTMVGATITIPLILTPLMCVEEDDPVKGVLLSTIIFVSGIVTLLQSTFGVRLPIVQGGTFSFLVPTIAILSTAFPSCADEFSQDLSQSEKEQLYLVRIREIQGAICLSALAQVIIGATGLIGLILNWITPLAIVPIISLIGLSLFDVAADKASGNWGIAIMTMLMLMVFSQYLSEVGVPIPFYEKGKGFSSKKVQIFTLFPVLLSICLAWLIAAIITVSGGFAEGSPARTDLRTNLLAEARWFYIPYPFQFGLPTVSVAGVFGMFAGVLASMIESVGDYYACARLAGASPPPIHAINRGIFIEGLGCIIAGIWGTGNGTTSYSENIGAIRVTKVGSRRVVQAGAVLMILFGCFGKFGALCVTIPDPVVGGVFFVMFGMITAVGLSNLQVVDLNSSRNLFVLGFSLFFGLAFPKWMSSHSVKIQSGAEVFDQIVTILLSTPMFVGGVLGFVLDNTIPGTREERGVDKFGAGTTTSSDDQSDDRVTTYDLPFGMNFIRRTAWLKKFPLSPTFEIKKKEIVEQTWSEKVTGLINSLKKTKPKVNRS